MFFKWWTTYTIIIGATVKSEIFVVTVMNKRHMTKESVKIAQFFFTLLFFFLQHFNMYYRNQNLYL